MVKLTPRALSVIRTVTAHPVLGSDSGLHIAVATDPESPLKVAAVPEQPADADILEADGGCLFLGPGTAERLEGREIDVEDDDLGRKQFFLRSAS